MKTRTKNNRTRAAADRGVNRDPRGEADIVLGIVDDLETHVTPDWWRQIFDSLYLKTDADVVADNAITSTEVDMLVELLELQAETRILDLCCGQGRHSLELARRGFSHVEGLDRSHYLIRKARKAARDGNLPVRFREGDARKIPHPPGSFDVVTILGNSFGYFETPEDDLRVLHEVRRVLRPEGTLFLDISDGDYLRSNYEPRSWEWISKDLMVCRERALSKDGQRLISREIVTDTHKGVIADRFYAERLYGRDSITRLLTRAGFAHPVIHTEYVPESQRNQDLGMMAQRILVTSSAPEQAELRPGSLAPLSLNRVAVLLGDPRKPDILKPASIFDEDDHYTVAQLKEALAGAPVGSLAYLDNHETLIPDLVKIRDEVALVFNLCDEGFDNQARKELHVPAILEMLGIPYTGAGPQCLAFCYDKSLVRGVAAELGIPVPHAHLITSDVLALELALPFPVIVKPNFGDSSFGITQRSVVQSPEELLTAVAEIREQFGYEKPILVEEFLTGKDLSVGIVGNPPEDYTVLPIVEEDYSSLPSDLPQICGYEAKWLQDSPYWNIGSIPAELPEETRATITAACVELFVRLECRDYARFDWRLDAKGNPKLLEVNPNPGWCWDGHLAKMAAIAGMSYGDMLLAILLAAHRRVLASL